MRRVPIGDWSNLATTEPKRYVTIAVVDGAGNEVNVAFDWEDADAFWQNVHRIASWLGYGGGLQ